MNETAYPERTFREILRSRIESGAYPLGMTIPGETELAETYSVTSHQVQSAVHALVREGLLRQVPGKGLFVCSPKMKRNLDELQGFTQTMLEKHVTPSFRIMARQLQKAGLKHSLTFGIHPEDDIYYIKRLCYADREQVSLEEIFIPKYVVPKLAGIDLTVFSIYEIYGMYGIQVERAVQTLDIVHLEQNDIRVLGMEPGEPVMMFQCTTYDLQNRAIEFNRNFVRGDKCDFSVHFNR